MPYEGSDICADCPAGNFTINSLAVVDSSLVYFSAHQTVETFASE